MIPWYAYAIGATIFGTAFTLLRKKGLMMEHTLQFEACRALSVAFIGLFFIPFLDTNIPLNIVLLIAGVMLIASVGIILIAKGYKGGEISHVQPLINLKSAFVVVLAYFFLSESVGVRHLIGIGIMVLGAYALEADKDFSHLFKPIKSLFTTRYSLYFIIAVFLFSVTALFDKHIVTNLVDPLTFLFLGWTFIAFYLNIIHGFLYGFGEIKTCFTETKGLPFIIAILSICANYLALKALTMAYVSLVTPVLMMSTLFVVWIGGEIFKEKNILYRVIISLFMLIGVYLVII